MKTTKFVVKGKVAWKKFALEFDLGGVKLYVHSKDVKHVTVDEQTPLYFVDPAEGPFEAGCLRMAKSKVSYLFDWGGTKYVVKKKDLFDVVTGKKERAPLFKMVQEELIPFKQGVQA